VHGRIGETLTWLGTAASAPEQPTIETAAEFMDQRTQGLIENVMDLRHGEHLVFTFDEVTPVTLMPHQVREMQARGRARPS
jgi:hypothetical protein